MAPIVAYAEVARTAEDVYAYATDPSRFAEWQRGVVSGRIEPGGTGTPDRCVTLRRIGFANRVSTAEIVRADAPRAWSVRGIDGLIRAYVDVTITAVSDARSKVSIAVDFEGHGIGVLLVPLVVRRQARREMPANVAALKERLERDTRMSRRDLPAVIRITTLRAKPGMRASLIDAARANADAALNAPGCLDADVCAVPDTADSMLVISRWDSSSALRAFLDWHEQLAHEALDAFMEEKPRSTHYPVLAADE